MVANFGSRGCGCFVVADRIALETKRVWQRSHQFIQRRCSHHSHRRSAYRFLLRCTLFWKNFLAQARVQFFFDVLLVTWLVWITGNVTSPYAALYIVIIAISSLFVGPRGAMITSVGSAVAFSACALAAITGVGPASVRITSATSVIEAIQTVGLSDVSFMVVGLLAAKLAERQVRSDVRLAEATRSLANLRALHERIVESIRSGVITTDLHGRIYTFNAAAEEITGYKLQDVRDHDASIFFGDMTRQIADSMNAAANGKVSPRFQADCLTPNGWALRLGFSIAPLFAESGETSGMVITFQDLTDIRVLEETSRRQDRMAAVGRLAVEIRWPLCAAPFRCCAVKWTVTASMRS